jgi:glycyl-tRNA synthetase beta chain
VGLVVALADKLELLTGLFGIGQVPRGDSDPFALRRNALGVIRILIERDLPLSLTELMEEAIETLNSPKYPQEWAKRIPELVEIIDKGKRDGIPVLPPNVFPQFRIELQIIEVLENFIFERLSVSLRDRGYAIQEIDSVLTLRPPYLREVPKRLAAVRAFAALPEAASLAAANKRVGNILKKEGFTEGSVDRSLLIEPAEIALDRSLASIKPLADAAFERGDYADSLKLLAGLKEPVDTFFDRVMVNADDRAIRANRLGLLAQLRATMNRVADLSKLSV